MNNDKSIDQILFNIDIFDGGLLQITFLSQLIMNNSGMEKDIYLSHSSMDDFYSFVISELLITFSTYVRASDNQL